jgi:Na+-translocating ferredoxin:NAD+ oxidoreductase RnfD subunit
MMNITADNFIEKLNFRYKKIDPRYIVTGLLLFYNILGITILGFNRSIGQISLTVLVGVLLHSFYDLLFNKKLLFNISAVTTSLGLCILVNYGHSLIYPLVPIFFAISSKFFFTLKGKHRLNPGMFGVTASLLLASEFISSAPAYQWNGIGSMALFIIMPALFFFMPKINRHVLVLTFLFVFLLQITLRSLLIRHYLPFTTLFFGSITSPAFFLFVFFMITDPQTSPNDKKEQMIVGAALAIVDLIYHLFSSYHTFFFAALTVGSFRFIQAHFKAMKEESKNGQSLIKYFKVHFYQSGYYKKFFTIISIALISFYSYQTFGRDKLLQPEVGFNFTNISSTQSGLGFHKGDILDQVDPRMQHMGKWFLAITDGVAIGDFDNDGMIDVFMTNGHKSAEDRNALFKNSGHFKFVRVPSPDLSYYSSDFKRFGVPSNAMFVDLNNSGVLDLYVTYAFGKEGTSRLFCNQLKITGKLEFKECTKERGLEIFSNSATANFFDFNNDGRLDLILGNTIKTHLPDYNKPTPLDIFELPKAEYKGDRRMFNFMHESWHQAENGGLNYLFLQNPFHHFEIQDSKAIGIPETKWTMAIATADFNQDGFVDLYMANDFGADDLYYNHDGKYFENIKGKMFGEIGRDTYKGMNATIADFDNNGYQDVQISNVHHQLQAEGNLLWYFYPNPKDKFYPIIKDQATYTGALNENRFGWGGAAADFNNDGWIDLAQANGMVDNIYDRKPDQKNDECPDFWYINEKIARSSPEIHKYVDNWGDIRGNCIHGMEKNRLYINRGLDKKPQFMDVADFAGMDQKANYRGMAVADFDNDGHMDLLVSSLYRNPLLFQNMPTEETKKNKWFGLKLTSNNQACNKMAIGSKIWLHSRDEKNNPISQYFETTLVNGFSAQHDPRVHMALMKNHQYESLSIMWCGRIQKVYRDIKLNQYQELILN